VEKNKVIRYKCKGPYLAIKVKKIKIRLKKSIIAL